MVGDPVCGDRHEETALRVDAVRRTGLGSDEAHDLAHDEAQGLGEVRLGREDVRDRDEELCTTHAIFTIRQPDVRNDTDFADSLAVSVARIVVLARRNIPETHVSCGRPARSVSGTPRAHLYPGRFGRWAVAAYARGRGGNFCLDRPV